MTDKELLEAAAKAAGIDLQHRAMFGGDAAPGYYKYPPGVPPLWTWWSPLTDDGDALRLAVQLRLEIDIHHTGIAVRTPCGLKVHVSPFDTADANDATRRAIVRAAAEIGRPS